MQEKYFILQILISMKPLTKGDQEVQGLFT